MFERFARSARTAVDDARFEASRRGDRRIGTDHLLLALLADDTLAGAVGADAPGARDAADELDRSALAAVGLELGDYRPAGRAALGRHTPLTSGAKDVLRDAITKAAAEKAKAISARHLLLAVLDRAAPDPASALLGALAVDAADVRRRLERTSQAS